MVSPFSCTTIIGPRIFTHLWEITKRRKYNLKCELCINIDNKFYSALLCQYSFSQRFKLNSKEGIFLSKRPVICFVSLIFKSEEKLVGTRSERSVEKRKRRTDGQTRKLYRNTHVIHR